MSLGSDAEKIIAWGTRLLYLCLFLSFTLAFNYWNYAPTPFILSSIAIMIFVGVRFVQPIKDNRPIPLYLYGNMGITTSERDSFLSLTATPLQVEPRGVNRGDQPALKGDSGGVEHE